MEARQDDVCISCVVPVFNEAANLPAFIPALYRQLAAMTPRFEIIAVNDGSRDDSLALLRALAPSHRLCVLDLSRNFGKEAALTAGIDHARGDVVILIDADFQHPVDLLPAFLAKWREGHDMVYGRRHGRDGEPWLRRRGTALFYALLNRGSPIPIPEDAGDFRLMDRRVADALRALPEGTRFMKGLYAWVGFRSVAVPFAVPPRTRGESAFGFAGLCRLALTGIVSFSDLPLRIWSTLGCLLALVAMAYGLYLLQQVWWHGIDVPGWATLAVSLMFFAGVQLLSVGILGEYLARVFSEVKRRPTYIVASCEEYGRLGDAGVPERYRAGLAGGRRGVPKARPRPLTPMTDDEPS